MKSLLRIPLLAASALCAALAPASFAEGLESASLLLYPEFNNQPGSLTILTITNEPLDSAAWHDESPWALRPRRSQFKFCSLMATAQRRED